MKILHLNGTKGFSILAVILVIVAVVVAIGVWALSGQSNTQTSANSTLDIQAASLINDSLSIKSAYDSLVISGIAPISVTYLPNLSSPQNILDPVNGINTPKPNIASLRSVNPIPAPDGFWIMHKAFNVQGMGTSADEYAIMIGGVKDSVCKRINYNLYGVETIDDINVTSDIVIKGLNGPAVTTTNPNSSFQFPFIPGFTKGSAGCIGSTSTSTRDRNLYFKVLQVN